MIVLGIALVDWLVLLLYLAVITAIGLYSHRAVKSTGDYFMGGRRFGKILMVTQAFSSGTRTDQAVAVMGASSQIGLAGIWYQWLYIFTSAFFWIIAPIYRRMRYITIGDFFERRFSPSMGAAYAFVGLIYFAMNIGIVLKATGITIEAMSGGAISTNAAVLGMMLFFLMYGLLGGLVAAVTTQFVQSLFILLLSFLLIPFALANAGGISGVREAVPSEMFSLFAGSEVTVFFVVMAVINALVGVVVQPHHMAINGAGKDEISCRTGWTYGNIVKRFATLGWAVTGIFLAAIFPFLATATGTEREAAFGVAVVSLLPAGFVGLMFAAIVAAGVAVCNSFMVAGSALFTRNFYVRYFRAESDERHLLRVGRLASAGVVVVGVVVALYIPTVVDGLLMIWRIMAFLGVAFWVGIVWRRANRYGAWASMVTAAVIAFVLETMGVGFAAQVAVYLPASLLVMIVASLLTPSEDEGRLNAFYSLLRTPVGHERRLVDSGIEMLHDGGSSEMEIAKAGIFGSTESVTSAPKDTMEIGGAVATEPGTPPLLKRMDVEKGQGQGLLLVDLLDLRRLFSFKRYRTDLRGFTLVWLMVGGLILLALILARLIAG